MALLALAFPVLLYVIGAYHDIPLQNSMSHYYFATPCESLSKPCDEAGLVLFPQAKWVEPAFPMRVWFVGLLFAIGALLCLYSGFSKRENYLLNLAGIFAWGVALFPMGKDPTGPWWQHINAHGVSALALFGCIAYVSWKCARDTLYLLPDERIRDQYHKRYKLIGIFMMSFPLTALFVTFAYVVLDFGAFNKYVFFAEALGVWTFALYWWVKSGELSQTGADKLALQAKIELKGAE